MLENSPIAIDLFAGAGGFGVGFELAGFSVPFSLEIDQWACDTLRFNHPNMRVAQNDIRDFTTPASIRELCPVKPDVIIGGPPCQGFSVAGPAKKDPKDPRNSLFINFAQWIDVLRPEAFIMENVKGLLLRANAEGNNVISIIKRTFADLGYSVEIWLLNAAEYGVPQIRERVFIVGHRQSEELGAPLKTHALEPSTEEDASQLALFSVAELPSAVSLWDAISDLPPLEAGDGADEQAYRLEPATDYQRWIRGGSQYLYNHVAMDHSARLVERFKHIHWGESSSDVPEEHGARTSQRQRCSFGGSIRSKQPAFVSLQALTHYCSVILRELHPSISTAQSYSARRRTHPVFPRLVSLHGEEDRGFAQVTSTRRSL